LDLHDVEGSFEDEEEEKIGLGTLSGIRWGGVTFKVEGTSFEDEEEEQETLSEEEDEEK
jgi:hypothetical protein